MRIDFSAFLGSFVYMAKGLLGIFIVTAAIVLMMKLLEKFTRRDEDGE